MALLGAVVAAAAGIASVCGGTWLQGRKSVQSRDYRIFDFENGGRSTFDLPDYAVVPPEDVTDVGPGCPDLAALNAQLSNPHEIASNEDRRRCVDSWLGRYIRHMTTMNRADYGFQLCAHDVSDLQSGGPFESVGKRECIIQFPPRVRGGAFPLSEGSLVRIWTRGFATVHILYGRELRHTVEYTHPVEWQDHILAYLDRYDLSGIKSVYDAMPEPENVAWPVLGEAPLHRSRAPGSSPRL